MADPQFGGTNGVPLLDIGQKGGVRELAATARLTGRIERGGEQIAETEQHFAQQALVLRDMLGFTGAVHRLGGVIKANTIATLRTIEAELDQRRTGQLRVAGVMGPIDQSFIQATKLTDFDGTTIAVEAVMDSWRPIGRIQNSGTWFIRQVEIVFKVLS